jgi:protein-S-isoprenylcysteine O-methyltransferase Ste14
MTSAERAFVWAGGAMFVAALAATAWAFAFTWAEPIGAPASGPLDAVLADVLLMTLFTAHHSLFARDPVKTAVARLVPEHLVRSVYVWTASVLLLVAVSLWQPIGGVIYQTGAVARPLLMLVQLAGLWFTIWGVRAIHPLELAGIRPAAGGGALQVRGPYTLVRHPLYFGWMLMVFGVSRMTGDRLTFAVVTTLYLIVAIPWEEHSLMRAFGGEYAQYRARVRWRMIPFVY